MIIPTKDIRFINKIIPLVEKLNIPYSIQEYIDYMAMNLPSDETLFLININDNNIINGYLYAEIIYNIKKEVFIVSCYVDPKEKKLGKEFLNIVEKWAKVNNIDRISTFLTEDKVKAFVRKYKFKPEQVYLTKEVNNV